MDLLIHSIAHAGGIERPWRPLLDETRQPLWQTSGADLPVMKILAGWIMSEAGRKLGEYGRRLVSLGNRWSASPLQAAH
jgi:hypothetical protein